MRVFGIEQITKLRKGVLRQKYVRRLDVSSSAENVAQCPRDDKEPSCSPTQSEHHDETTRRSTEVTQSSKELVSHTGSSAASLLNIDLTEMGDQALMNQS